MWLAPILSLAIAVAPAQEREVRNPHTTPSDVAAGARIFRGHCGECHGLRGEGGRGPNLTSGVLFHGTSDADLFRNITDGIPGTSMPSVFFSADQVWQIVAYVRSLSAGASERTPPGDPVRGKAVFRDSQCFACHLVRGEGGTRGPDLSNIGSQRSVEHLRQAILEPSASVSREFRLANLTHENNSTYSGFVMNEDTYDYQLLDFSRGLTSVAKRDLRRTEIIPSSSMPAYKGRLSDSQVTDLVAYLWSLRRTKQ